MPTESLEWILLSLSPFLALGLGVMLYHVLFATGGDAPNQDIDHRMNVSYKTWREWTMANGGARPIYCSRTFDEDEKCFAYACEALSYEPTNPHGEIEEDAPVFDTPCGMPVGEGWSILDCFDKVRSVGRISLFVTDRNLYFTGTRGELKIPLHDVWMVATACSSLMVKAKLMDRPLILTGVNGQMLRDTIYMLLEAV